MKSSKPFTAQRRSRNSLNRKSLHKTHTRQLSSIPSPSSQTTQSTSSPLQSITSYKTQFSKKSKQRFTLFSQSSQNMSGCASGGCGCDDTPSSEPQEDQPSEQQQKTIEKMKKQQREFSLRLYRGILRQHRHLPPEMRIVGDPYVKEEFRLHKNAKPEFLQPFYEQWIDYLGHLRETFETPEKIGRYIEDDMFHSLSDEQQEKLVIMHRETVKLFGPGADDVQESVQSAQNMAQTTQTASDMENSSKTIGLATTSVQAGQV